MPRKRKNDPIIHRSQQRPATKDEFGLSVAVEEKFKELCESHLRITRTPLLPPDDLRVDFVLWRESRVRHKRVLGKSMKHGWSEREFARLVKRGDFTFSDDEVTAIKRIAQWTVDVNNKIRNQPEEKLECLRT